MNKTANPKYVILEDGIPYDWDDFDLWGAVLYDIENENIVTTRYGHGSGMTEREVSVTLETAINEGLVTEDKIKAACLDGYAFPISDSLLWHKNSDINIPCVVSNSCRLIKGDCILLKTVAEPVRYGLGAYRNEYNYKAIVYSPSLNKIASVSTGHISFADSVIKDFRLSIVGKAIRESNVHQLAHVYAYGMSYSACDTENKKYVLSQMVVSALPYAATPDISTASYPQQEAIDQKKAERKAKKMPELREWARGVHPEYSEEEVEALAEKVWNRRYA